MNKKDQPLVSVIMNCYNGEKYLRQAIDSIYAQTYENWEIIFWDNCSTDRSAEIAKSYIGKLKYFKGNKYVPLGAARKKAVEKAAGKWIGFLDTDDLWDPNKLSVQIEAIDNNNYILCYAGVHVIKPSGDLIHTYIPQYKSGYMLADQLLQFDINMVTPLVNKKLMDNNSITFEKEITASEEYNLFLRLMAKGKVCVIPKVLGTVRISEGTTTDREIKNWAKERFFTLEQLKKENPRIELIFPEEFQEAHARGVYYKARYLMSKKKYRLASKELKSISLRNKKYFILYICSFIPALWKLISNPVIKRRLTQKLLG
ncbi:MAG: glycosyltransferase family 2 protein [Bacteroidetes bacterium]|nr:glycosyltransferase family 2 protein [Bacteroidota bacterium]